MEFCSRVILVTVVGLTLCFMEPAISQRVEGTLGSDQFPLDLQVNATAVEERYGGINITWDVQPAADIASVQPRILTNYLGDNYYSIDGIVHPLAKHSQCFSRVSTNKPYHCLLIIRYVHFPGLSLYNLDTLPARDISKSLNLSTQMPILNVNI